MNLPTLSSSNVGAGLGRLLELPTEEALRTAISAQPELRGPLLRKIAALEVIEANVVLEAVGWNACRFAGLPPESGPKLLAKARAIAALGARGELLDSVEPCADPYRDLARPAAPSRQAAQSLQHGVISREVISNILCTVPAIKVQNAQTLHDQTLQANLNPTRGHEDLIAAVAVADGLRWDEFVRQHQLGETGFYSQQLNLQSELGLRKAPTPANSDPIYVKNCARQMLGFLSNYVQEASRRGRRFEEDPFVFAELGGGGGEFKLVFLDLYDQAVEAGFKVPLEYVSVDLNHFQRLAQTAPGTSVRSGDALATGLSPSSVDFLFSDEVASCFPHRWFRRDKQSGAIVEEAFVVLARGALNVEFRRITGDPEILGLDEHLEMTDYALLDYRFSRMDADFWKEARRIIRPGGNHVLVGTTQRSSPENHKMIMAETERKINSPMHSLGRGIDPDWMLRVGRLADFTCKKTVMAPRPNFPKEERVVLYGALFSGESGSGE